MSGDGGGGDGVHLPGGKKISPKVLVGLVGVVVLLVVMRARSGGGAAAAGGSGGGAAGAFDAAEQAMLAQLQSDNAKTIEAQLNQIPAGARGPTGPRGAPGPRGTPPPPLIPHPHPIPPGTVHKPAPHPGGGGSGVPVPKGHFYVVKPGDTVSKIAKRSRISDWHRLLNPKTDKGIRDHPNLIHPGQKIWIPA